MRENLRKAIFLDRDCTIIEDMEFSVAPEKLRPLPGALEAMRRMRQAGYALVIITNQSGVGRGHFTEEELRGFHRHLVSWMKKHGVEIAGVYYCPHYANGSVKEYALACECRKPGPGMVLRAAKEMKLDLANSWMIGDRPADIGAGKAAGCRTIRVLTGPPPAPGDPAPDFQVPDMISAAKVVLGE